MTPRSCSTPSAAIVDARTRARRISQSPARLAGSSRWTAATMLRCSCSAFTPNGTVGFVDEQSMFASPASSSRFGACPPPQPSMWKRCTVRPSIAARVPPTPIASFSPSVWIASCTSKRSQTSSAQRSCSGPADTSSWIFRPPPPARRPSSSRSGRAEDPRTSMRTFSGIDWKAA